MTRTQIIKPAATVAAIAFGGLRSFIAHIATGDSRQTDSRIQIGLNIAPVKLNLNGLDPAKVAWKAV